MPKVKGDKDLYLLVAIGGVIGAFGRHALTLLFPPARDGWPMATFVTNLTGAFILGAVIVLARELAPDPDLSDFTRRLRPLLVTGILGGYTTFSTYIVEAHGLAATGHVAMSAIYILGSLVAGVICVALGMVLADLIARRIRPNVSDAEIAAQAFARAETEDEA